MLCSNESMAVQLDLVKKSDAIWNPDQPNYVPFIPNGNDLLPGEAERMRLQVQISGSHVNYSEPIISGGENGSESSYYSYDHEIINNSINCAQNAENKF